MQIGELDAILEENQRRMFTPEILEVVREYYPKFSKQRQTAVFVAWLNKEYDKDFAASAVQKRYLDMKK